MKLRNKKTGEIGSLLGMKVSAGIIWINIEFHDREPKAYCYNSLAELNEEWEDCNPTEPLIKDEKIRSIVRTWIRANNLVGNVESYGGSTWIGLRGYSNNEEYWKIELKDNSNIKFGDYSLTELCGDDEE